MQRRHFLMSSGAAAQAVFGQNSNRKVTTAVIGVGNRGAYLMGEVLKQQNAQLVAICDTKADRLDAAATKAAAASPKTTRDWHTLIDDKSIDAVYIATPPHLHVEMAIAALQAGKHVYCEKPIGTTADSIRDLIKVVHQSNKVFHVGQQLRSYSQISAAIKLIHEGAIGDVLFVKAQRHASADLPHDFTSSDWYYDKTKSGGYLVEQSVHNLDACNWAIGQRPIRAAGFGGINYYKDSPKGRNIMDHQSITYDYANGVKLSFTMLVFHPKHMPVNGQTINVYGSKGSVELMNKANFYSLDGNVQNLLTPEVKQQPDAHTVAFYDCILNGKPSNADITVGATGALTAILGNQVCEQGRVIHWDEFGVDV